MANQSLRYSVSLRAFVLPVFCREPKFQGTITFKLFINASRLRKENQIREHIVCQLALDKTGNAYAERTLFVHCLLDLLQGVKMCTNC